MIRILIASVDFQESNSPLSKVRHRILILLGSLGGRCNLGLLGGKEAKVASSKGIAWDTKQHLSFAVPFQDMKPTVFLGETKLFCFGFFYRIATRLKLTVHI